MYNFVQSRINFYNIDYAKDLKDPNKEIDMDSFLYQYNNYEMPKKEEYVSARDIEHSKIAKLAKLEMEVQALKETESKLRSQLMSANLKIAILEIQNGKKVETITTHNFNKQKDNNKYKEDELNSLAYDEFMKGL